jgi:hypothetical protein
MEVKPLNKFRRLKEFSKFFKINKDTVIAYDNVIYADRELYPDVIEHEKVHFKQQKKHGLETFTKKYLNDKKFRLEMEKEAYLHQLKCIEDKDLREAVRKDCINGLTSGLYGKISKEEAEAMLPKEKEEKGKIDVSKLV